MKRVIVAVMFVVVFVAGVVCCNLFETRTAEAGGSGGGLAWEKVKVKNGKDFERLGVPGGWLVNMHFGSAGGLTFVPDPNHEWK